MSNNCFLLTVNVIIETICCSKYTQLRCVNFRNQMSGLSLLRLARPRKAKTKRQLLLQGLAKKMPKPGGASNEM